MKAAQEIVRQYRGERGQRYHGDVHGIPDRTVPWLMNLRAKKFLPYIRSHDVVFEYGVGMGWNIAGLPCARRLGYDIAEHLEPVLRSAGIEFVSDPLSIGDGDIDVVICHHVLEHTPQPLAVLETIHRILRKTGRLILVVPYEMGPKYRRYDPSEPNHHLYSWNVQSLGNLVASCGFQIIEARSKRYGYDRFAAVWADRFHLKEEGFRLLRGLLERVRPLVEVWIVCRKKSFISIERP